MGVVNEYELTLQLPRRADELREGLIDALGRLGYRILNEHPIHARRKGRDGYICGNLLAYPATLIIQLKPIAEASTRATFNYAIEDKLIFNDGDRLVLDREAAAIVALASRSSRSDHCKECDSEVKPDSRFCRQCGSPIAPATAPELEVMRLTATLSGAREDIFAGLILLFALCLILTPLFFFLAAKTAWIIGLIAIALLGGIGTFSLLYGMRSLHLALKGNELNALDKGLEPKSLPEMTAEPRLVSSPSITEQTTSQLSSEPVAEWMKSESRDTSKKLV